MLKKTVLNILALMLFSLLLCIGMWEQSPNNGIPVLNYHQVNLDQHTPLTLSPYEFETQLSYLRQEGYHTITPRQLADYVEYGQSLPDKPIVITFDDGYMDNYQEAYPLLEKYGFKATFFVIANFVGTSDRYMNWEQLKELNKQGYDIESHTLTHKRLPFQNDDKAKMELVSSKKIIEKKLDKKVEFLAYPGGEFDQRIEDLSRNAGYRAAFTVNFGRDYKGNDLFQLHRIPIFEASHTFLRFWLRLKLTPVVVAMQQWKNQQDQNLLAKLLVIP